MAKLEYKIREVKAKGFAPATVVELIGSVDPTTLGTFQKIFESLIAAGRTRLIIDMRQLKYINSTGMGITVQFVDELSEKGGGLVFLRVQPKVQLVLEMLGLQALFQIVGSEAEALGVLGGAEAPPSPAEVKLEEMPLPAIEPPAPTEQIAPCQACGAQLSIPGPGTYRCPRCRSALQVEVGGRMQAYRETTAGVFEMSAPADEDYFAGVNWIINMAGQKAGLTPEQAQVAAESVGGCLKLLTAAAMNGSGQDERLHLFIRSDQKRLTVRIYCGGSPLESTAAMDPYRAGVDQLEYSSASGGNLITLEKEGKKNG